MKIFIFCLAAFQMAGAANAQPYIDLVNARYMNSPDAGLINRDKQKCSLQYYNVNTNIPFQSKHNSNIVILSPFFEQWKMSPGSNTGVPGNYFSIAVPASYIYSYSGQWKVLYSVIPKINYSDINNSGIGQIGGAILATYQKTPALAYKFGLYYNSEFFGNFFIPLAGIDWRINVKNKLFGVLPGSLAYEHKLNTFFYYGVTFHAVTNSYREINNKYFRVDDNQLGLFGDVYVSKNFVLNAEVGHSLFRKVRSGQKSVYLNDLNVNDNCYFKISLAYRIRFDEAIKK